MALFDGFAPPPLQAMLVVKKTTETKNTHCITTNIAQGGRGGTI